MNPVASIQSIFPLVILSIFGSFALSQQADTSRQTRHARGTAGDTELEKLQLTEEELLQDLEDLHRLVRRGTEDLTSLNCPPCERLHCSPKKASKLNCKGEITLGVCNCCPRCAKVEGESCGGKWDYLGRCESGSECVPDTSTAIQIHSQPQGVCRRRLSVPSEAQGDWSHDQPPPGPPTCQPKCTPEYCRTNSKAICSAT
ncbi:uncharacterized protein LOC121415103 [Lytechinus variegatus]|uniref:uncharacterized protein LOC121415103 n=1 Tax=Lytechinus variegatus TaxID=7654 RepID=UPI001BB23D2E|nr:uncharacterized protein LOC121415103 [Lytechinus variegatus]